MAKKEDKKKLEKKNWISTFMLIGEAKVNDYTYKIDEKSEKSDWIYNHLNLGVDCGEKYGTIYSEMMGGYGSERDNVVYVHGKKDDGSDDFENRFTIDWDDRFDTEIIESIGSLCFMTVGLEKDKNGKVYYKKFLTSYDAILYIKQNLESGMVLNVKGNLKYSTYNDNTVVKKEINSVVLSKVDDSSKYSAKFTQTVLLQKDSIGKPDKDKNIIPIYAKVLDYVKEMNGIEVKGNVPFNKAFEYEIDLTNKELVQKAIEKVFRVKKGVTEITFEGDLIESGALVTVTEADIPDDIKELIEIGAYTLEEALTKCTENTGKEKRMVLRKPVIKMVGDEGEKTPVIQKFEQKYSEEDLLLDCLIKKEEPEPEEDIPFDVNDEEVTETEDDEEDWLKNL